MAYTIGLIRLPLTKMGEIVYRIGLRGRSGVNFGHDQFKMSSRHLNGKIKLAGLK